MNKLELEEVLVKRLTEALKNVALLLFLLLPQDILWSFWEVFWTSVDGLWASAGGIASQFCHEAPLASLWL